MPEARPVPVVFGTAGHIDHGKSALIEALCGSHPDRWREEQERGITIDLGYAQMSFEDGLEIGFVDVPGHEKLVRKMVAGATGMGAAMLVVACDDGVMPQTREHFEVLQLLGVDRGLVVLTKADVADEESQLFVEEDVSELVQGTSWEEAPLRIVSAHDGTGLEELRQTLRELAATARTEEDPVPAFRLPVQRAFAIEGAGTVVTGVCASGQVMEGQDLMVLPGGGTSRVRRVQVHGREADRALAGLRVALNLPGFTADDCPRGVVLVEPGTGLSGSLLRMTFEALPSAPELKHGSEVQLLAGTAAVTARVFLGPEMADGRRFLDVECEEEVCLIPGQRCLLRRPSPAQNFGMARFLGYGRFRLRRRDQQERDYWLEFADCLDDRAGLLECTLKAGAGLPRKAEEVAEMLGWTVAGASAELETLAAAGRVQAIGDAYVAAGSAAALMGEVAGVLDHFRKAHPECLRIPTQRFRARLGKKGWKVLEGLADGQLEAFGLQRRAGTAWDILGAEAPPEIQAQGADLLTRLEAGRLSPPDWKEFEAELGAEEAGRARSYLIDSGQAVAPIPGLLFAASVVEDFREQVVTQLQAGALDIPSLRDRFQTSRKFVMPLLEYLDHCGVTERNGPNRLLRDPHAELMSLH